MAQTAPTADEEDAQDHRQMFFKAQYQEEPDARQVDLDVKYTTTNGPQLAMSASTNVPTEFMGLPGLNINYIPIRANR